MRGVLQSCHEMICLNLLNSVFLDLSTVNNNLLLLRLLVNKLQLE